MFTKRHVAHLTALLIAVTLPAIGYSQQFCQGPELEEFEFCALDAMEACSMDYPSCSSEDMTGAWLVDSIEDGFYTNCCEKNGSGNSKISCLKNALRKLKRLHLLDAAVSADLTERVSELVDNLKEFESCDAPDEDETPPEDEDPGEGEDDEF